MAGVVCEAGGSDMFTGWHPHPEDHGMKLNSERKCTFARSRGLPKGPHTSVTPNHGITRLVPWK